MTPARGRSSSRLARDAAPDAPDLFAVPPLNTDAAAAAASFAVPVKSTGESAQQAIAVSTLTETAKAVLEGAFTPLWVRGEVSDFKAHRNGHWYFCLRDATAQVRCVVWSRNQRRIPAPPDDGMQVSACGQLSVYAARGDMQFVVTAMEAAGDGLWRKALELSLKRLQADGLTAPERKRRIPAFPRRIAVITSPDGAALRDVMAVVRRRWPLVELVVVPAKVQGEGATEELIAALGRVNRWGGADTVIIGRGGGAREDLWAFNDERVARALAACTAPTISAVGHEVDTTLCDLVADLRAPTPSAAAEAAVPVLADERDHLGVFARNLRQGLTGRAADMRARLELSHRDLRRRGEQLVESRRARLEAVAGRLHALSPLATLARGFAVARGADGEPLTSAHQFSPGLAFALVLRDGRVPSQATGAPELSAPDAATPEPGE